MTRTCDSFLLDKQVLLYNLGRQSVMRRKLDCAENMSVSQDMDTQWVLDVTYKTHISCYCLMYDLSPFVREVWLGGAVVTRLPLTATAWVQLQAACGMSFTLYSQCLVVFPLGFSLTLRRAQNCSNWNRLIRLTCLARTCSG